METPLTGTGETHAARVLGHLLKTCPATTAIPLASANFVLINTMAVSPLVVCRRAKWWKSPDHRYAPRKSAETTGEALTPRSSVRAEHVATRARTSGPTAPSTVNGAPIARVSAPPANTYARVSSS